MFYHTMRLSVCFLVRVCNLYVLRSSLRTGQNRALIPPHQVHKIALLRPGVVPKDDLVGNAWKQSAMEAWLPLVDILVGVVANKLPAPAAPPSNSAPWLLQVRSCTMLCPAVLGCSHLS